MSKTLHTIQVLAKIGKILSKIIEVFCIIGCIGCLIGLVSLNFFGFESFDVGGVTIHGIIENSANMSVGSMNASMLVALVLCAGEVILAKKSCNYFIYQLDAGTPFTMEGADKMRRLGIATIVIPIVTMVLAQVVYAVSNMYWENVADMHIDDYVSIGLGIGFIVVSFLCKLGAEQQTIQETEEI